jgi:tetratricopeptide (TPR) repeat protein
MFEQGTILAAMGRRQEAVDLIERAYALAPANPELAIRAAAGLIAAGETMRAEELLIAHHGTPVVDHELLVGAYVAAKDYNRLIATIKLQVENQPDSPELHYRLATAYALAGRFAEARQVAQAAMARFPQTIDTGRAFLASLPGAQ